MIRSLVICYAVATSVALILPCIAVEQQPEDVQPDSADQSTKTPGSTPTPTPDSATTPPPESTEPEKSSVGQQLLSLPPPFPKQPAVLMEPPSPAQLQYDDTGKPNLLSREIFLQPDPVAFIIRMVATLPSTTNLQEQVTLLNDVLKAQQAEESPFNIYVQGVLLMLQHHTELQHFIRAVSEIQQSMQSELGITDGSYVPPEFDMSMAVATEDLPYDMSSAQAFTPPSFFPKPEDFRVYDDYYYNWQQDMQDESEA